MQPSQQVVLRQHRCKVRTCPTCGPRYGFRVRQGLLPKADQFTKPALLTLTCNRSNFESPDDAHSFITQEGLIRRLLRVLGVKRYVWVLEFQQKTGEGWPHWHILVDLADVPSGKLDLARAWRLWRDKWGCGGVDLQLRRQRFTSPQHAIHYITKYMTKYPEKGYPAWVLQADRRIRFFTASRSLGPILSDPKPAPAESPAATSEAEDAEDFDAEQAPADESSTPTRRRAAMRPLAQRMAECKQLCTAVLERRDEDGEVVSQKYLGTVRVRHGRLAYLAHFKQLHSPLVATGQTVFADDTAIGVIELIVPETPDLTAAEAFEQLENELHNRGEYLVADEQIAERMRELIENNAYLPEPDAEPAALSPTDDVPF